jgi:hypothetical protein
LNHDQFFVLLTYCIEFLQIDFLVPINSILEILLKSNSHHSIIPISTLLQYNPLICLPLSEIIFQYIFHFLFENHSPICLQQCANSLRQIFSVKEFDEFKISVLQFLFEQQMILLSPEIFLFFGELFYLDLELAQRFENAILSILSAVVQCDNPSIYIEGMILCLLGLVELEEINLTSVEFSFQTFCIISKMQNASKYICKYSLQLISLLIQRESAQLNSLLFSFPSVFSIIEKSQQFEKLILFSNDLKQAIYAQNNELVHFKSL